MALVRDEFWTSSFTVEKVWEYLRDGTAVPPGATSGVDPDSEHCYLQAT